MEKENVLFIAESSGFCLDSFHSYLDASNYNFLSEKSLYFEDEVGCIIAAKDRKRFVQAMIELSIDGLLYPVPVNIENVFEAINFVKDHDIDIIECINN